MSSGLKVYSLGIVVRDILQGESQIVVSPIEKLYMQKEGGIFDWEEKFEGSLDDIGVSGFKSENIAKGYLVAEWLRRGDTNRVTAPDVYQGETVILYKYADVDMFYWEDVKLERNIRRLEDVKYAYSNINEPPGEEYDDDSSYWVRVNTRDKFIHLHTSQSDGEPYAYDIKIDTSYGSISVTDNTGNIYELDSPEDTFRFHLNNEFNVVADENINLEAGNDVTVKAGNDIIAEAGNDVTVDAGNDITATAGNDITAEAGSNLTAEAGGSVSVTAGADMALESAGGMTLEDSVSIDLTVGETSVSLTPASIDLSSPTVNINGVMIDQAGNIIGATSYMGGPVMAPNNKL